MTPRAERLAPALAPLAAALVALLPFLRFMARGESLYFRDLSRHFFPLRLYALDGLRQGELRYWNPLLHGGLPTAVPPIWNPLELLALLRPDEAALSWILVLHVPLAAAGMAWLMQRLGASAAGAAAAGVVYALGGFALSTINFYLYVQTLAWAPFAILGLHAAARDRRAIVPAALACGLLANTAGLELVAQALVVAALLALPGQGVAGLMRAARAVVAGTALAAPTLFVLARLTSLSERARGFSTDVVLAHSVHPFTLLQVLVSDLYGDTERLADVWWGVNFFPRGFPYFLSLYLGAAVVGLATAGALGPTPARRRLLLALAGGLWVAVGRWAGLEPIVDALPFLHSVRNPSKAFFAVHLAVAMLAGWGVHHVAAGPRALARRTALVLAVLGALLVATLALPIVARDGTAWFVENFFPTGMPIPQRLGSLFHMLGSAAASGTMAIVAALVAGAVAAERLPARRGAVLLAAVVAGDLLRAGAGLNPTVATSWFRPSEETRRSLLPHLAHPGAVLYNCEPAGSASYWKARALVPHGHEALTFSSYVETLTPNANVPAGVRTALSEDLTSLVPSSALAPADATCARPDGLVPHLRAAGVTHVVGLDPIDHAALTLVATADPPSLRSLRVFLYRLADPQPLVRWEGRPEAARVVTAAPGRWEVEARGGGGTLVVDDRLLPGWTARVDGAAVPIRVPRAGQMAVDVPAGASRVRLRYEAPGLRLGTLVALAGVLALAVEAWRGRRATAGVSEPTGAATPPAA